ncbi:hypothetical protein ACI2KR_09095 [Pseudomonas luteola]
MNIDIHHPESPISWQSLTDSLPVPDKRYLTWYSRPGHFASTNGSAIFGSYDRSVGWSLDFDALLEEEVSHFAEISPPNVPYSTWRPIDEFPENYAHQEVILWCGNDAVCGHQSLDMLDPERDSDGWVIDFRWRGMSKPTYFMLIKPPQNEDEQHD